MELPPTEQLYYGNDESHDADDEGAGDGDGGGGARGAHEATAGVTHLCRRVGRVGRMRRQQVSHICVGACGARCR